MRTSTATDAAYSEAYAERVREAQADNKRLQASLDEWVGAFDDGLTDDQAAHLFNLANRMRKANRIAAQQVRQVDAPSQDDGQTMGNNPR